MCAPFYIFSDIRDEAWPPEFGGDELVGFKVAGVAGCFVVATVSENGFAKGVVIRDIDTSLVGEDAGLYLPVRELGAEG
jgi:hypothetical protein